MQIALMALLGMIPGKMMQDKETTGQPSVASGNDGALSFGQVLASQPTGAGRAALAHTAVAAAARVQPLVAAEGEVPQDAQAELLAAALADDAGPADALSRNPSENSEDNVLLLQVPMAQQSALLQQQDSLQGSDVAAIVEAAPTQDNAQAEWVLPVAMPLVAGDSDEQDDDQAQDLLSASDETQPTIETLASLPHPAQNAGEVTDDIAAQSEVSDADDVDLLTMQEQEAGDAYRVSQRRARDVQAVLTVPQPQPQPQPQAEALPVVAQDKAHGAQALNVISDLMQRAEQLPQHSSAPQALANVAQAMNVRRESHLQAIDEALADTDAQFADALLKAWRERDGEALPVEDLPQMDDAQLDAVIQRLLANRPAQAGVVAASAVTHSNAQSVVAAVNINTMLPAADVADDATTTTNVADDTATLVIAPTTSADTAHRPLSLTLARADHQGAQAQAHNLSDQVQMGVQRAISEGQDRITIELKPKELGRIDVRMDISASGHASVVFAVEKPETLGMLQRDARQLQQMLADAGLDTGASDMQFNLQQQQQSPQDADNTGDSYGRYQTSNDAAVESQQPYLDATTGHYTIVVNEGVNIRV